MTRLVSWQPQGTMGTADAYPFKLSTPLRFARGSQCRDGRLPARSRVRLVDRRRQLVPALEYGGDGYCLGCWDRSSAGGDGGRRAVRRRMVHGSQRCGDVRPTRAVSPSGPDSHGNRLRVATRGARCRRGRAPGRRVSPRGRSGKQDEGRIPRHDLARAPYAIECRARMGAPATYREARCHGAGTRPGSDRT